jgi:RNA polymerase sigma-70 factor (ECF subfamily)
VTFSAGPVYDICVESTPREAALVEAAKSGDVAAYEALLRMHQTVAYRTAFAITRSADDAEEVVQAAFLKAHRAVRRFRRDAAFRPWLLTIVANEARNRRRSGGRRDLVGRARGRAVLLGAPRRAGRSCRPRSSTGC